MFLLPRVVDSYGADLGISVLKAESPLCRIVLFVSCFQDHDVLVPVLSDVTMGSDRILFVRKKTWVVMMSSDI